VAGFAAALIVMAVAAILPYARLPLPVIAAFLPMAGAISCFVNGLTAYFLAIQFRASREPFLGALAGAYGFVAVAAIAQAGPQATPWIWLVWHSLYPAFMLAALLVHAARLRRGKSNRLHQLSVLLMAGAPLMAGLLAWLVIAGPGALPRLTPGDACIVAAANIFVAAAYLKIMRLRDYLSPWVAVALLANFGDALLQWPSASDTLGWYAGPVLSLVAAAIMLCALIFEFHLLYDQLQAATHNLMQRALRDGLTGAFNRGYFMEQCPRELRRAVREHAPLSLLLIDVDHFKSYNDRRGHQMGDQCLIAIVSAIRQVIRRPADFIARYGGEEFAVVLPQTDGVGAQKLAEAVRAQIFELCLSDEMEMGFVTVSVGITTFDPAFDSYDMDELVRRADQALYQAKRDGRDTSRVYKVMIA